SYSFDSFTAVLQAHSHQRISSGRRPLAKHTTSPTWAFESMSALRQKRPFRNHQYANQALCHEGRA
ncbi:MAG: hypothetical protein ACRCTX_05780, partial [Afipia sp.]